eukprot:1177406-Prorocentrum_minimum.AAC.1
MLEPVSEHPVLCVNTNLPSRTCKYKVFAMKNWKNSYGGLPVTEELKLASGDLLCFCTLP